MKMCKYLYVISRLFAILHEGLAGDGQVVRDVKQRGYVIELLDNLHRTFLMALEEWNARRVWSESRQFVAQQIFMTRQTNHDKRLVGHQQDTRWSASSLILSRTRFASGAPVWTAAPAHARLWRPSRNTRNTSTSEPTAAAHFMTACWHCEDGSARRSTVSSMS